MYCRIWLTGSQFIHTCYILLICKGPTSQNQTSQLTVKIVQNAFKRDIFWYRQNLPKATRYLNRNSYFYRFKARKNKYDSSSNLYNCFLWLFCLKYKKSNRNHDILSYTFNFILVELNSKNNLKLLKYLSKFPAQEEKI